MEIFKWALQKIKFQGFCSNFALHHRGLMYHLAGILLTASPAILPLPHPPPSTGVGEKCPFAVIGSSRPYHLKDREYGGKLARDFALPLQGKIVWSQLLLKDIPHCKSMVGGLFTPSKEKD